MLYFRVNFIFESIINCYQIQLYAIQRAKMPHGQEVSANAVRKSIAKGNGESVRRARKIVPESMYAVAQGTSGIKTVVERCEETIHACELFTLNNYPTC